ncbi:tetraspanin [Amylocystis lapponica]|nr:tetraspanin [Amylocystis lapponica]
MPSGSTKIMMSAWGVFDVSLLIAGVIATVFSIIWREPNLLLNFTLSTQKLDAGLILGILFILTFLLSMGALMGKNNGTMGFVLLNWMLVLDAVATLIVSTAMWFYTLQERNNYYAVWKEASSETRLELQNLFSCCGYFAPNDTAEVQPNNFCSSTDFVNSLFNATATTTNACVTPITKRTDVTLNQIFTYINGFMAVVICLFLATLCVIKTRTEKERFRKIDAKRGGGGFV